MAKILEPYVSVREVIKRVPDALAVTGTSNIGLVIVAPVGPPLAHIAGPKEFLATYTSDGVIPRNADISFINAYYLSFTAGLVIARAMNTTATQGVLVSTEGTTTLIKGKDGQILTKNLDIAYSITEESKWSFVLNDTVFFKGTYAEISVDPRYSVYPRFEQCESIQEAVARINNWREVTASFKDGTININCTEFADFITDDSLNDGIDITIPRRGESGELSFDELIPVTREKWLFSVLATTAQVSDIYKVGIKAISGDSKLFELLLTKPNDDGEVVTESYMTSLFTEAVDLNGSNAYLENLNTIKGFEFEFNVFETEVLPAPITNPVSFGASGLDMKESKKSLYLNNGVNELEEQVLYDIEYLAPAGITDLAFTKRLTAAGKSNDWFTPIDVPVDRTNANSIQMYFRNIDNSSNVYACGPFDKNSGLTGWINYIACSTLYYERVMRNKAMNAEFAPVFDAEFGTVQLTNPVVELGKTDREKLLNFGSPVNFAGYDQRTNIYYMNNNLTHQNVNDIVSEEQNRRLVNKIKKDIKRLMNQFKGKYNTSSTRENVLSLVNYYFKNNIMNIQFKPERYELKCDEENNPAEVIRANQLALVVRVRLYNSIKYIDVLNEVFPIGVDFS